MGNEMGTQSAYGSDTSSTHSESMYAVSSNREILATSSPHQSAHRTKHHSRSRVKLIPISGSPNTTLSSSLPNLPVHRNSPDSQPTSTVYHLSPGQSCTADELTEEEQIKVAQRMGLIQHLPRNTWDDSQIHNKKVRECCICMLDFEQGEPIRYLPCMHYYHLDCIDDWLMRSFTCPSCMEPVDAALLSTYGSQNFDTLS